jgi:hypothetical protein
MSSRPNQLFVEEVREVEPSDPEEFDRVSFALDAVRALGAKGLTVSVYPRRGALQVQAGRDWRRGEGAVWVMLGIPPRASRVQIAEALANATGRADTPYAFDVLLNAGQHTV